MVGARPEFIQCAPVIREVTKKHQIQLIHTGQHYDYFVNNIIYDELKIPNPDINLGVGSSSHGIQTGEMMKKLDKYLSSNTPSLILVFGDTNSTLAGALVGVKKHIMVCHIESGMRSYDRTMPEEINRVLVDHCSDVLFCSTKTAIFNLKKEGLVNNVYLSGDVSIDSLRFNKKIAEKKSNILNELDLEIKDYYLITLHRAGNTDNKNTLKRIITGIQKIKGEKIFPLHPRTEKRLKQFGLYDALSQNVKITNPLGYFDFIKLMENSKKIITDSGGIQKEAYILKIPCITIRKNTEWVDTVKDGWNVLVGDDPDLIFDMATNFSPNKSQTNIFGKNASKKILQTINSFDGQ